MEPQDYTYIKRKILQITGIDLEGYKCQQMQRRLQAYLTQSGYDSWPLFFRAVQSDPVQIARLRDYLTINVSSFFRDPDKYQYLRERILPELLRHRLTLQIWSAGCSHGYEPYSLAILLAEITPLYRPHQILATDIDPKVLARGEAGGPYTANELAAVSPDLQQRYFESHADGYWITSALRRKVRFHPHDLLAGDTFSPPTAPAAGYDLIVCRNVVIYFTEPAKARLYRRFYEILHPGGILFLGSTENIPRAAEIGFEIAGLSFYRRKA